MPTKKVLIVEDEPQMQLALTQALVQAGFGVLQASTGQEGFIMELTHHPDLVIADRKMPGFDGIEMVKRIRQRKGGESVMVIFLTNLTLTSKDAAEIEKLKPVEYLVKSDVSLAQIVEKVKAVFPGS